MQAEALAPEWDRIDLLGACLAASRRGESIVPATEERLGRLQRVIEELRREPPWQGVVARYGLDGIDQEIVAFALAPDAEPRLGWMFQALQAGVVSPYPTAALVREMLGLESRAGRIEASAADAYTSLRPTSRARAELLGWHCGRAAPIGAVAIRAAGTRDDLVLPRRCLHALDEFLLWVTCRETVVDRWGGRGCGGPVALFSGPSGTGKTFAAEALANALEWPLYRVDLGLLVSKYIGETEKNLNALFDAADGEAMLLLFDEADALFGRRGEVKDPCILTTNLRQALDPAFARRFQAVIEFPRPDPAARTRLWQLHLPPRAPLASEVDCRFLGESVSLTGGQIRNAALHAAYLAAGEQGPIDLSRIARAVWAELAKDGRERTRESLGAVAHYLPMGEALDA